MKLQAAGFDGPAVAMLIDLPANHAHALVTAVLAERTHNQRPHLELVWSGPEAAQAQSRDIGQVLRELFAGAEHDVIVRADRAANILFPPARRAAFREIDGVSVGPAGFAFWGASTIFEPLYQRALDRPCHRVLHPPRPDR